MYGQIDITIQKWGYDTSRELKNVKNSRKVKSKIQESDDSNEDHF